MPKTGTRLVTINVMGVSRPPQAGTAARAGACVVSLCCLLALASPPAASAVGSGAVAKLRAEPCPPAYLFSGFEEAISAEEVTQARQTQRFRIAGKWVKLDPPINWHRNPVDSQSFRNSLVAMNWTKPIFKAYGDGDTGAI